MTDVAMFILKRGEKCEFFPSYSERGFFPCALRRQLFKQHKAHKRLYTAMGKPLYGPLRRDATELLKHNKCMKSWRYISTDNFAPSLNYSYVPRQRHSSLLERDLAKNLVAARDIYRFLDDTTRVPGSGGLLNADTSLTVRSIKGITCADSDRCTFAVDDSISVAATILS